MKNQSFWFLGIVSLALTGCGSGSEATVIGLVTLDGKPLDRGSVSFVPVTSGAGASASIGNDGSYEVQTGAISGMSPGDYVVTVRANGDPIPRADGGPPTPGKPITPAKYNSRNTSGLQYTIQPGANEINLELKS